MATFLQSIGKHLPTSWNTSAPVLGARRREVLPTSVEYGNVKTQFRSKFPTVVPTKIERVESAHLFGMYLLKKAEYGEGVREMSLWHATSVTNALRIIETNLDWRRAERVKFGKGVSFSPSTKYANLECNRSNPRARVSILCKVLVKHTARGNSTTTLPPPGVDTTTGNDGQVYVKYCDNEFYPEYLVYYDSPGHVPVHRNRYDYDFDFDSDGIDWYNAYDSDVCDWL